VVAVVGVVIIVLAMETITAAVRSEAVATILKEAAVHMVEDMVVAVEETMEEEVETMAGDKQILFNFLGVVVR